MPIGSSCPVTSNSCENKSKKICKKQSYDDSNVDKSSSYVYHVSWRIFFHYNRNNCTIQPTEKTLKKSNQKEYLIVMDKAENNEDES